jgi:hypothetical protein
MRVVLAEVLRRKEFETTTAEPEHGRVRHVTLVPAKGALCTVRRVRSTDPPAPADPVRADTSGHGDRR